MEEQKGEMVVSSTVSNCYFPYDDWRWDRYYPVYYPVYKEVNDNRYEVATIVLSVVPLISVKKNTSPAARPEYKTAVFR